MPKSKLDKAKLRIDEANQLMENGDQTAARKILESIVIEFRNSNSPTITNAKTKLNNLIKAAHQAGKCFYSGVVELLHLENQNKGIIAQLNRAYDYKEENSIFTFCLQMKVALKVIHESRRSETNLAIESRMMQLLNEYQNTAQTQLSADLTAEVIKASNSNNGLIFTAFEDDKSKEMYLQRLHEKGFYRLTTVREIMQQGDILLLRQFIDIKDNVLNYDNDGFSPIHYLLVYADKFGKHFEIALKILLDKGEMINRKTIFGLTALHMLCMTPNQVADPVNLAKILLDNGCSVNEESTAGITPLCFATRSKHDSKDVVHTDLVKYLVDSGAHINLKVIDSQGEELVEKEGLFDYLIEERNIPGLNALLQANAALGITFQIPRELIRQLDAKDAVVISFFNGKFADKSDPVFRGFKNAITTEEELVDAYLNKKVSLDFVVQIQTRIEKIKDPSISDAELTRRMTQLKEHLTRGTAHIDEQNEIEGMVKFYLAKNNTEEACLLVEKLIANMQAYAGEAPDRAGQPTLSRK